MKISLPYDVSRCVDDTCTLKDTCLRWLVAKREQDEESEGYDPYVRAVYSDFRQEGSGDCYAYISNGDNKDV